MEGDDIDFSGIDEDLEQFQQDDIVRQALRDGVDLRGYARDIQMELREVRWHFSRVAAARNFITQLLFIFLRYPQRKQYTSLGNTCREFSFDGHVAYAPGFLSDAPSSRLFSTWPFRFYLLQVEP